jgi:hypothetical protein
VLEAVLPRPSDARLYADALRGALARLMRRPAAGAVPTNAATPPGRGG